MLHLPPLDSLRFFEAAARHQSFVLAGKELGVTAAAVAHRIRTLEKHLDAELFERRRRSVRLNAKGRAYLKEVQRILAEVHGVSEQQRSTPRRVRIVSVEAVAEKWLLPRLASFKAAHPDIAIELETNHRSVDPALRDFDAWLAYSGETSAPRPLTRREDTLLEETLYEEALLPVCSPALLAARGRPRSPAQLRHWPLLYDPRLERRLVLLVRPPGPAHPGPLAGLGLPPLLDADPGGRERARRRHRPPHADRPRARTPDPGAPLRPPAGGARALLPDHHRRLAAAARAAGVPELDPARGAGSRRPPPRAFRATPDPVPGAAGASAVFPPQRAGPSGASESQDPRLSA